MMAKKGFRIGLPEPSLEAKLIAVEGDGLIDVADDEEWRNCLRLRSRHKLARLFLLWTPCRCAGCFLKSGIKAGRQRKPESLHARTFL